MKTILIKLSGEVFATSPQAKTIQSADNNPQVLIWHIAEQLKILQKNYRIAIVVGGGNFFRGKKEGKILGLRQQAADTIGMFASVMNGFIISDIVQQMGIFCTIASIYHLPGSIHILDHASIHQAFNKNHIVIFAGGTGNPYFSTDTAAIIRALQIDTNIVWKASTADYVYDTDPKINIFAKPLKNLSYKDVLNQQLGFMDTTAITLAQEHNVTIRFFNIFRHDALIHASSISDFGSIITGV